MNSVGLSVTIISRDEEDRIGDAIRSVAFADEVVVLDSGSRDGTVALCRTLGARVIQTDWPGYVAQQNRALKHAKYDWVLSIDSDERVSPQLAEAVQKALSENPPVSAFWVARRQRYLSRWIHHCGWYPNWRIRLFRRSLSRWVGEDPHYTIETNGSTAKLTGDLLHDPYRNISEHIATINRYSTLFATQAHAEGRRARWWDLVFRPPLFFLRRYLLSFGFLDGIHGVFVCGMGAFYVLCRWMKLFELQRGLNRNP